MLILILAAPRLTPDPKPVVVVQRLFEILTKSLAASLPAPYRAPDLAGRRRTLSAAFPAVAVAATFAVATPKAVSSPTPGA